MLGAKFGDDPKITSKVVYIPWSWSFALSSNTTNHFLLLKILAHFLLQVSVCCSFL